MNEYSTKRIIISILTIGVICVAFYFLTIAIIDNQEDTDAEVIESEIQYTEIRLASIYNQTPDVYYVLVQLEDDIDSLIATISDFEEVVGDKLYTATLDNGYNSKYYEDDMDLAKDVPTFKETTLVKVENDTVVLTYSGVTDITEYITNIGNAND